MIVEEAEIDGEVISILVASLPAVALFDTSPHTFLAVRVVATHRVATTPLPNNMKNLTK